MSGIAVLLIGQLNDEWPPLDDLLGGTVECQRVCDLDAAARFLSEQPQATELILLAQSRPGQFTAAQIDALRRLAPLARIWRIADSWCEGEARSGHVPPGCLSTYAHQWQPRWARELSRGDDGSPQRALPVTTTSEERAMAAADDPLIRGRGLIAICARHAQTAAALADACQLAGYTTQVVCESQDWEAAGAVAVLWDTDAVRIADRDGIKKLRDCAAGAPVLALVSFPRATDVRRAVEAGLSAVISKPFLMHDLAWHIDRAASRSR